MTDVKALLAEEINRLEDAMKVFDWSIRRCSETCQDPDHTE